jgi:hypothetical protein
MSPPKSKVVAFNGQVPIRSKIVSDNIILASINTYPCLVCRTSHGGEKYVA